MLGIQTRGGRMEGANESTELRRHPRRCGLLTIILFTEFDDSGFKSFYYTTLMCDNRFLAKVTYLIVFICPTQLRYGLPKQNLHMSNPAGDTGSHQRTLTVGENVTVWLVSSLTGFDLTKQWKLHVLSHWHRTGGKRSGGWICTYHQRYPRFDSNNNKSRGIW